MDSFEEQVDGLEEACELGDEEACDELAELYAEWSEEDEYGEEGASCFELETRLEELYIDCFDDEEACAELDAVVSQLEEECY